MSILKKFLALSVPARAAVVGLASVDGAARLAAIRDVLKRDASQVHGPKLLWVIALAVVNSGGLLPLVYRKVGVIS